MDHHLRALSICNITRARPSHGPFWPGYAPGSTRTARVRWKDSGERQDDSPSTFFCSHWLASFPLPTRKTGRMFQHGETITATCFSPRLIPRMPTRRPHALPCSQTQEAKRRRQTFPFFTETLPPSQPLAFVCSLPAPTALAAPLNYRSHPPRAGGRKEASAPSAATLSQSMACSCIFFDRAREMRSQCSASAWPLFRFTKATSPWPRRRSVVQSSVSFPPFLLVGHWPGSSFKHFSKKETIPREFCCARSLHGGEIRVQFHWLKRAERADG